MTNDTPQPPGWGWSSLFGDAKTAPSEDRSYEGREGLFGRVKRLFGWSGVRAEGESNSPAMRDLVSEDVRTGPAGVVLPWFLPYFDEQQSLGENAQMRLAYRKMFADPNVKAAVCGKVFSVGSLDLKIVPADKKSKKHGEIADFVRWNFEESLDGGFPELAWNVLFHGALEGYSVCEKVLALEDMGEWRNKLALVGIKPKDAERDLVLETDDKRNIVGVRGLRYNPGQVFHPSKFLIYRHMPLWGGPTGMSDLRAAYGSYWMLDTARKLRAIGLEKRSLPVLMGTFKTAQQQPTLARSLAKVKSQNWLTIPEGVKVEALNIAGSADSQFADAIKDLKHDIFLGIQGAILQSLEGSVTDGRGSSQVHRTTADLFVWYLSQSLERLLNDRRHGVITDLVNLNYVTDKYPKVRLSAVDQGELQADLAIDKDLISLGLPLSKSYFYEKYGRVPPDPADPDDVLTQAKPGGDAAGGNSLAGLMGGGGDAPPGPPGGPQNAPDEKPAVDPIQTILDAPDEPEKMADTSVSVFTGRPKLFAEEDAARDELFFAITARQHEEGAA